MDRRPASGDHGTPIPAHVPGGIAHAGDTPGTYVDWAFDNGTGLRDVAYSITVERDPGDRSQVYWSNQVGWTNGRGGYAGYQTNASTTQRLFLFSVWGRDRGPPRLPGQLVPGLRRRGRWHELPHVAQVDPRPALPCSDKASVTTTADLALHTNAIGNSVMGPVKGIGGTCVHAADANNGTPATLQSCAGSANQSWVLAYDGTIRSRLFACLDANGSTDGAAVTQWSCSGGANQAWTTPPKS